MSSLSGLVLYDCACIASSKSIFEACQVVLLVIFKWSQKIKLCFTTLTHEEKCLVLYIFSASVIFPSREREKLSDNVSRYLVKGHRTSYMDVQKYNVQMLTAFFLIFPYSLFSLINLEL